MLGPWSFADLAAENHALMWLCGTVENHLGICTGCAGAIKHKFLGVFNKVKAGYLGQASDFTTSDGRTLVPGDEFGSVDRHAPKKTVTEVVTIKLDVESLSLTGRRLHPSLVTTNWWS
jgi:hypothetical protein